MKFREWRRRRDKGNQRSMWVNQMGNSDQRVEIQTCSIYSRNADLKISSESTDKMNAASWDFVVRPSLFGNSLGNTFIEYTCSYELFNILLGYLMSGKKLLSLQRSLSVDWKILGIR